MQQRRRQLYQYSVLLLTFLAYMSFHATRKVPSIVKTVLHPLSSDGHPTYDKREKPGWRPFSDDVDPYEVTKHGYHVSGAGTLFVNGDYDCKTKSPVDDFCMVYAKQGDSTISLRVGNFTIKDSTYCDDNACWVFIRDSSNSSVIYYYQEDSFMIPAEKSDLSDDYKWHPTSRASDSDDIPELNPHGNSGKILLGTLDTIYLGFYAIFMFPMGRLAETFNKRYFLFFGMVMTSIFVALTGMAYYFKSHSMVYWSSIYALQGIFQSTGWPTVVGIMGNWCGHGKRGLIMGLWNAHTSVGNIVGSLLAAASMNIGGAGELGDSGSNWAMAFFMPAIMMFAVAVACLLFLKEHPRDVGLEGYEDDPRSLTSKMISDDAVASGEDDNLTVPPENRTTTTTTTTTTRTSTSTSKFSTEKKMSIFEGLCIGIQIPGVVEFSLCLMFAKCVAYTFIYWTPYYLAHNGFSTSEASYLCTFVDVGGIFGGILAGFLSDRFKLYASVAVGYLIMCLPGLLIFHVLSSSIGDSSVFLNILLMIMVGALVNGPYALITTAVSADLGQHKSLKGNATLMSTVTAIIDGCGSIGAAMQGYLVSWIADTYGWDSVFSFLMICCAISALMLTRQVLKECCSKRSVDDNDDDDAQYDELA